MSPLPYRGELDDSSSTSAIVPVTLDQPLAAEAGKADDSIVLSVVGDAPLPLEDGVQAGDDTLFTPNPPDIGKPEIAAYKSFCSAQ